MTAPLEALNVGFTGTRAGMTKLQRETLERALFKCAKTFTHGCCVGSDAQAHESAWCLSIDVRKRPSDRRDQRAKCKGGRYVAKPAPPLVRNKLIVRDSDILMATPRGFAEEQRSGTWMTIRYARKSGVIVLIIWPDGSWKLE